ncbi:hypothetical protein [Blastochloris viridis]|uniref:hypothetical protein n=1 Tax=Blastochloris viridis TaxID=1079 RepID=UPI0011A0D73C|nr:hypothetical protein [Blastochloris viridis]
MTEFFQEIGPTRKRSEIQSRAILQRFILDRRRTENGSFLRSRMEQRSTAPAPATVRERTTATGIGAKLRWRADADAAGSIRPLGFRLITSCPEARSPKRRVRARNSGERHTART